MTASIEVVGTAEVASMLGVSRQRVLQLSKAEAFPAPLARLSMGNVWLAEDIREWSQRHRVRPKQP